MFTFCIATEPPFPGDMTSYNFCRAISEMAYWGFMMSQHKNQTTADFLKLVNFMPYAEIRQNLSIFRMGSRDFSLQ